MTEQDARVAGYAWERGRALVLLVNKWDAVPAGARTAPPRSRRASTTAIRAWRWCRSSSSRRAPAAACERIWGAIDARVAAHRSRLPTGEGQQPSSSARAAPQRAADGERRPPAPLLRDPDRDRAADGHRLLQRIPQRIAAATSAT